MSTTRDWFELTDTGVVKLKIESKAIPEVVQLLKDKQSDKYWQYIWHLCSHKSPYASYTESEREEKVREDFLKEEPNKLLLQLIVKYRQTLETTSMRLLRAAQNLALEIAKSFETDIQDGIGDRKEVMDSLGKVGKIIESLDKLDERVKKEITNEERIRGGGEIRSRER